MNANLATGHSRSLCLRVLFIIVPILIACGRGPSATNSNSATGSNNTNVATSTTSGSPTSNAGQSGSPQPTIGGAFSATGSMMSSRLAHTATMLLNGRVLIVGGGEGPDLIDGFFVVGGAELFDPSTGTFASAGTEWRDLHTATLLPNGKVLLIGGETGWTGGAPNTPIATPSAELYDPGTGLFQPTGNMNTGRESHTATLLADGRVLVTGGATPQGGSWETLQTAEVYDPASGTFLPTGNMVNPRIFHTATLLSNGKVLVTGGNVGGATAELYDPVAGSFALTGKMSVARSFHTATLLSNGKVLVVGGATADVYDPGTGVFTPVGPPITARSLHTATLLEDGTVLIAGGAAGASFAPTTAAAEIYDPAKASFANTGRMGTGRLWHTATPLPNGNVIVIGGASSSDGIHITALKTAEIWDPFDY
jgi:Galactose oxidase, central domain